MSEQRLQEQREWASELEDALHAVVEERLKTVWTSCPGIVKSFDRNALTATVQPAQRQIWITDDEGDVEEIDVPICTDVPVQFTGGGGVVLTVDLAVGDEVILLFSHRCIDEWRENGGTQTPQTARFHDLSDGMAVPAVWSKPRAATVTGGVAAGGAELRTLDGTVLARVDSSGVTLGQVAGASPVMLLTPDVITWLTAVGSGSGAGPYPLDIGATLVKGK